MNDLEELRKKIDSIDSRIIGLLAERMKAVEKIAKFKKANGFGVFQKSRERKVLKDRKKKAARKKVNEKLVEQVFRHVMKESRRIQKGIIEGKK